MPGQRSLAAAREHGRKSDIVHARSQDRDEGASDVIILLVIEGVHLVVNRLDQTEVAAAADDDGIVRRHVHHADLEARWRVFAGSVRSEQRFRQGFAAARIDLHKVTE